MMKNEPIFMNLMTDFAFKRLFGTEKRKYILIRFLNALFEKDNLTVTDVMYHDKEVLPDLKNGKRILYDVYCTTPEDKEHIILEMQHLYHDLFEKRAVYYAAKALASQLQKGSTYDLKPVYSIFLVDFHFNHMSRKEIHDVTLMDRVTHEVYSDILRMFFVHLSDTKKRWEECKTEYEKIVFLIKNMHKMDKRSKAYKSGEYDEMFREAEISSMVAEDVVAYSDSVQKYYDDMAALEYATRAAQKKGLEMGMEEGRAQGMAQGMAQGKEEIIRTLFANGMKPDLISDFTNIPPDKIMEILNK